MKKLGLVLVVLGFVLSTNAVAYQTLECKSKLVGQYQLVFNSDFTDATIYSKYEEDYFKLEVLHAQTELFDNNSLTVNSIDDRNIDWAAEKACYKLTPEFTFSIDLDTLTGKVDILPTLRFDPKADCTSYPLFKRLEPQDITCRPLPVK